MSLFNKRLRKSLFVSLNIILFLDIFPVASKLEKFKKSADLSYLDNQIQNIDNKVLENVIQNDEIRIDHLIYYLTASNINSNNVNDEFYIDIESDKQYRENDIYYAEGDVTIKLKNGIIKADKFFYDRNNSDVELKGNISFRKGKQYFQAEILKYNFDLQEGFIKKISGSLNLDNLNQDLNLDQIDVNACSQDELDLLNRPEELELLNSKNARLDNILGLNFNFEKISNWKFNSDKIIIKPNLWQSAKIQFTNDPYDDPQFVVESKNFSAEIKNDNYKFTSKSTFLILENQLRIPVGNRTISDGEVSLKWGVGYEKDKKDGLYIYRKSDIFQLTKNLEFSYKPYFLVQRAIIGKTKSFRSKDASFVDPKIEQTASFTDFFGIQSDLKGKIFNFDSKINLELASFNSKRLNDSLSIDANFLKNLYYKSNQNSSNKCSITDQLPIKTFSVKSGFYAAYLKDNIYSAYGTKLLTDYSFERENIKDNLSLIFDLGTYKGKALKNKRFLGLERYGINTTFKRSFKLFDLNKNNLTYDSTYKNTPNIIDKAFFLNTKLSTSVYQYSNDSSQRVFLAGIGPSFTIGNLKNNFLDYSYLSIMSEFVDKEGQSPFAFDDLNSDSRIKFVYSQQLYGPILFGISSDLIISNESKNYGKFVNTNYTFDISRRAYKVSFFYKNKQSFGLKFNIFNFRF